MAAQASQTSIVNKAITMLGSSTRLLTINDNHPVAKAAVAVWDYARDEVTVDHPWNHALYRAALPASDYVPVCEYAFAYELPSDNLRWLPWNPTHENYAPCEQEGDYLLSNASAPLYVRGIRRIEDLGKWSIGFSEAMAGKLCGYIAKAVTGSEMETEAALKLYEDALRRGKRQDGQATGRVQRNANFGSNWLGARSGHHVR